MWNVLHYIAILRGGLMLRKTGLIVGLFGATAAVAAVGWTVARATEVDSGVNVGGMLLSFRPSHLTGPDKGTNVCPLCQYPKDPAVQVWVTGDDTANVLALAGFLDQQSAAHAKNKLKTFVVFASPQHRLDVEVAKSTAQAAVKNGLKRVSIVYVGNGDLKASEDNDISPEPNIKNTIFVYKERKVSAKFVNLRADAKGTAELGTAIEHILK